MRARPFIIAAALSAVVFFVIAFWPRSTPQDASFELQPIVEGASSQAESHELTVGGAPAVLPMDPPPGRASRGNEPAPKLPEDAASGMNASRRECGMAPVLPNGPDVEMDTCSGSLNLAEVLDTELRDPVWATEIEIRLRNAISAAEELELARVEVDCRMTSCGILLVHAVGADNRRQQSVVSGLLSEAGAFQQWAGTAPIGATADG
jgi:hypothetical protein